MRQIMKEENIVQIKIIWQIFKYLLALIPLLVGSLYLTGTSYFNGYISYWGYNDSYRMQFESTLHWGFVAFTNYIFDSGVIWLLLVAALIVMFFSFIIGIFQLYFYTKRKPRKLYVIYLFIKRKLFDFKRGVLIRSNSKVAKKEKRDKLKAANRIKRNNLIDSVYLPSVKIFTYLIIPIILLGLIAIFMSNVKHYGKKRAHKIHTDLLSEKHETGLVIKEITILENQKPKKYKGVQLWCSLHWCGIYIKSMDIVRLELISNLPSKKSIGDKYQFEADSKVQNQ